MTEDRGRSAGLSQPNTGMSDQDGKILAPMRKPLIDPRLVIPAALREAALRSGAILRLGYPRWLRTFVRKKVLAITLGRRVYVSPGLLEQGEERLLEIVRHELAHVDQVREVGLVKFLVGYAREYVANRRRGLDPEAAYESISFEVQARAAEMEPPIDVAESGRDTGSKL